MLLISGDADGLIKIWNITSGINLKTLVGHSYWVKDSKIGFNATKILSCSTDNTIKIWDIEKNF